MPERPYQAGIVCNARSTAAEVRVHRPDLHPGQGRGMELSEVLFRPDPRPEDERIGAVD